VEPGGDPDEQRRRAGTVVHVLPSDLHRGAQVYAQALLDTLDDDGQVLATIFDGPRRVLRPGVELRCRDGAMRRLGMDPRAVLRLRRLLHAEQPDVVVAHGGESLKYLAVAGVGRSGLVYVKIGTLGPEIERPLRLRFHAWAARRADRVVAVSRAAAREAIDRLGVDPTRVVVIPNGRDPKSFRPSSHDRSRPRVAFVGALTATKRPLAFVELIRTLRRLGVELDAVMAGAGPLEVQLAAAIDGVDDVALLGPVTDIPALLADIDVLVFPSEPSGEGMPGVLIEAALAGVPVVATKVPGADEVVDNGVTGLLVDVGDDQGLGEATAELVADPERRQAMGDAARQRALAQFTVAAGVAEWRTVLADARLARLATGT